MNTSSSTDRQGLRIDKWLWCARFFKSRSLASEAVSGGLVHVNGERVKASREIHTGDTLLITRGETRFEVVVESIPTRRGPAQEARGTYAETEASVLLREQHREQQRLSAPASYGRPDKHGRRALRSLRGR